MSESKPENPVLMGAIGAPHGVRGQLRVRSFTEVPLALGDYGTLFDGKGNAYDVADIRAQKGVVVVTFKQVKDRNAAEALNGVELFVGRSQLPDEELEEDEFFVEDLVGMAVVGEDGAPLGTVSAVLNFGAGDMIEVKAANGKTEFYPFTRDVVPEIDFDTGTLVLVPPGEVIVAPEGSKLRESDPDNADDAA